MDETKETQELKNTQDTPDTTDAEDVHEDVIPDTSEEQDVADDAEIAEADETAEEQDVADDAEIAEADEAAEEQDVADDAETADTADQADAEQQTVYVGRHVRKNSIPGLRRIISTVIIVVLAGAICFGVFKLWKWHTDNQSSSVQKDAASAHVKTVNEPLNVGGEEVSVVKYDVDFDGLLSMNPDTVAWLKVEGTEIEYPVVHTGDNSYYLTYSYDGSYNSAGWIFADYKDACDGSDRNLVIYGHNRRDGSMFGSLHNVFSDEWLSDESNRYVVLVTENEYCIYEVFSIYSVPVEDYYITTSFGSDSEFGEFLNVIQSRSQYDFGVELSGKDKILTLSTCSNMDAHRVVLHAKKLYSDKNK